MKLCVVIPCYKSSHKVAEVISSIPPSVDKIIAVNDACPENTGDVLGAIQNERLHVFTNPTNLGVGGATKVGWTSAIDEGFDFIIKLDSDGQMDPKLIDEMTLLQKQKQADVIKGNRFYRPSQLKNMPKKRLFGNSVLSLVTKFSSGYWSISDPTNGLLMISASTLKRLPLDKLHDRYFFESDLLFRLGLDRASIAELPMDTVYEDEVSSLREFSSIPLFISRHLRNVTKRFYYRYVLADFGLATINTLVALPLLLFGLFYGLIRWVSSTSVGEPATAGQVMIAALPIIIGVQMLSMAISYDIANEPGK